jgi:hypothetical protein
MEKQSIFVAKSNPLPRIILQVVCMAVIVMIMIAAFYHDLNPFATFIIVTAFAFLFLMTTHTKVEVYSHSFELKKIRVLPILSRKFVAEFSELEAVDFEYPEFFYPGIQPKNGSIIFKYKDGTYKRVFPYIKKSQLSEIFNLLSAKINQT